VITIDGTHIHDFGMEIVDLNDSRAEGSVWVCTNVKGLFQEKDLGVEAEMFVLAAEDAMGGWDGLGEFEFVFGDVLEHEGTEQTDSVGFGVGSLIGAWKDTVEPIGET
jgi:hypothetical protein